MSEPFLGEIRLVSWDFPPKGWAFCRGQLLPINQNQALFSILGTMYGGNGQTNFALPNLQGRSPVHRGDDIPSVGYAGGSATHTLNQAEMPQHTHPVSAAAGAELTDAAGARWGTTSREHYATSPQVVMATDLVANAGGSQAHENMPPYLTLSYVIALQGIYPSQN